MYVSACTAVMISTKLLQPSQWISCVSVLLKYIKMSSQSCSGAIPACTYSFPGQSKILTDYAAN